MVETERLGGLYDGFEVYRTATEADYRSLLTDGLVVPDTNVFLNLYRYNEQTRNDLFTVLGGLGEHLWVPRHVMVEFWRKRETVLLDPRDTDKTVKEMAVQRDEAISTLRSWANRVGLPPGRTDELGSVLSEAFGEVIDGVGQLADDDASQFASDTGKDPVLAGLEPILLGRVGRGLDETDYKKALEEAKQRAEAKRPPGYKDAGRPGDYLIWVETLREAERRQRDVLIVTGDVKEDWWRQEHGKQRGPRPELAEEMRTIAGTRLFMLRPESLLRHAREILQVEVREESVQDIERVSEAENGGWSIEAVGQFLARLSREGWSAQEQAIRMAALRGGFVEREIVYSLGGYDEGRSLRGFTRPINRIAREFREHGIVSGSAVDILVTEYDPTSPNLPVGWASGFRVPEVLVPLVLELAKDWQVQALLEPDPDRLAIAFEEFRGLGHDVDESTAERDEYGRSQWFCRRCGTHFYLQGTGERWISPSGRAVCPHAGMS